MFKIDYFYRIPGMHDFKFLPKIEYLKHLLSPKMEEILQGWQWA